MAGEGKHSESAESADQEQPQADVADLSAQEELDEKDNDNAGKPGAAADSAGNDDQPVQELPNGTFRIIMGNSTYVGKTRDEALKAAQKGVLEKDKAFHELRAKAVTHKGARIGTNGEGADELPPEPKIQAIAASVFKERGLDLNKANFTDADWIAYQEEKGLRDWQISKEQRAVEEAAIFAQRAFDEANLAWYNMKSLDDDITPAVQALVAEAGLDEQAIAVKYLEILQSKEVVQSNGLLSGAKILAAVSREIIAQKPALKNSAALRLKEKEEAANLEKRKAAQRAAGGGGSGKHKVNDKAPTGLVNAHKLALQTFAPGR